MPAAGADTTRTEPRRSSARTTSRGLRTGRRGIGSNHDRLRADKFRFEVRISVLEQHGYNFARILSEFIQRRSLRVRSSPARNIADEKARLRVALDNRCKTLHAPHLNGWLATRQPMSGAQVPQAFVVSPFH